MKRALVLVVSLVLCGGCGSTEEELTSDAGASLDAGTTGEGTDAGGQVPLPDAGEQPPDAGGGGGASVIPCEPYDDLTACPGVSLGATTTVLEALGAAETSAKSEFPEAFWQGGLVATHLPRGGTLSAQSGTVSQVAFCANNGARPDILRYYFSNGTCTVERTCGAAACGAQPFVPPTVDSEQAIAAAFPDDPADKLYLLSYGGFMGNYWSVTHLTAVGEPSTSVKVDASTGQVIP